MSDLFRGLPPLAGVFMLCAAIVALAGEGEGELGARALARDPEAEALSPARTLRVMHLTLLVIAAAVSATSVGWWAYQPGSALLRVVLVTALVWAVGDLAPRLLAALAHGTTRGPGAGTPGGTRPQRSAVTAGDGAWGLLPP
jgi:hypothetical protein